jgi:U3 small nucleolar RNA-associated protein 22
MEYTLCQHLSLSSRDISVVGDQLDIALLQGDKDPIASMLSLLDALEVLSKRLRGLDDLPLQISSV